MATSAEQLILRGLHMMIRASFSPNSPDLQAKHFMLLQNDIGPWMRDYAEEIEKPSIDFPPPTITIDHGGSGVQG